MNNNNFTLPLILAGIPVLLMSNSIFAGDEYCVPQPIRTEALDNPGKHAWDLFITVNHPAKNKKDGRGLPDCSKPVGAAGTTSTWETWRNAGSEVFLTKGAEPPLWDDLTLPDEKPGQIPVMTDADGTQVMSAHSLNPDSDKKSIQFDPNGGVFDNQGGFGETRMNRATYDFIRDQCLFSRDGLFRYAKAVADKKKPPISFPIESIEVKAAWLDLGDKKIPKDTWSSYYLAEYQGKTFGLTSLHIITKDIPNWFWASFHHKDVPDNTKYETTDTYGPPPQIKGTIWENYVLGGTQVDFVFPTGKPTKLSDYYVEYTFQNSSCITCHSTAAISPVGPLPNGQRKALCAMTLNVPDKDFNVNTAACKELLGQASFKPNSDELLFERGTPDPSWFTDKGTEYIQTDFAFSMPIRSKKEEAAPPKRCIW